ncbi:hypothetical protein ATK86_3952 [Nocardia fluminea]|uniref:Uncharacterized protein n=1 Tax=Nocardia fluminea TaxID=134984 RepID=A0A2N3VD80_9NOCA|nr:hypothetical protein ATK86_3952 [Nocardia fluminea]
MEHPHAEVVIEIVVDVVLDCVVADNGDPLPACLSVAEEEAMEDPADIGGITTALPAIRAWALKVLQMFIVGRQLAFRARGTWQYRPIPGTKPASQKANLIVHGIPISVIHHPVATD